MSDFIAGSSEFAASSEGFIQPITFVFNEIFKFIEPLTKVAEGASDLLGMFA